jgi:hypothetical protein
MNDGGSTMFQPQILQIFVLFFVTVICESMGEIYVFFVRLTLKENTTKREQVADRNFNEIQSKTCYLIIKASWLMVTVRMYTCL